MRYHLQCRLVLACSRHCDILRYLERRPAITGRAAEIMSVGISLQYVRKYLVSLDAFKRSRPSSFDVPE